jgi:nitrate reductase beta subunit
MRRKTVDCAIDQDTLSMISELGLTTKDVEGIYELTTQPTPEKRFVLPPYHREMSVEMLGDPLARKGEEGLGYVQAPRRGG